MPGGLIEYAWLAGGVAVMLLALVLGLWALLADRARGRRRCPRCWYDMSGNAGLRCPECGREARRERDLSRTRRRWGMVVVSLFVALLGGSLLWRYFEKGDRWRAAVPTWALILMLDAKRPWTFDLLADRLRGPDRSPVLLTAADRLWGWQADLVRSRLDGAAGVSPSLEVLDRMLGIADLRRAESRRPPPPPRWIEARWTPGPAEWLRTVEDRGSAGLDGLLAPLSLKRLPADDWIKLPKASGVEHDVDGDGTPDAVLRIRRAGLDDYITLLRRGERWTLAAFAERPRDSGWDEPPFLVLDGRLLIRRGVEVPGTVGRPIQDLVLLDAGSPEFPEVATLAWQFPPAAGGKWTLEPDAGGGFTLRVSVYSAAAATRLAWHASYIWSPSARRYAVAEWHWTSPNPPSGRWRCPPQGFESLWRPSPAGVAAPAGGPTGAAGPADTGF